jgi:hypothetical protein
MRFCFYEFILYKTLMKINFGKFFVYIKILFFFYLSKNQLLFSYEKF